MEVVLLLRQTRPMICLRVLALGVFSMSMASAALGCDSSMLDGDAGDGDSPSSACAPGAACGAVGAMCGEAFEFSGYRCVGPEQVWAACHPYNGLGPPGPANGCPSTSPAEGSPCCRAFVSGLPHGCLLEGQRWECRSDHWTRTP